MSIRKVSTISAAAATGSGYRAVTYARHTLAQSGSLLVGSNTNGAGDSTADIGDRDGR